MKEASIAIERDSIRSAEVLLNRIITSSSDDNSLIKAYAHRQLASVYGIQSRKSEQIQQLFNSYWLFKKLSHPDEAEALRLIGKYYLQVRLYDKAEDYLNRSLTKASASKDTLSLIRTIGNLGQLEFSRDNLQASVKLFEQSINLSQLQMFPTGLRENWSRLSYAYGQQGNGKKMLECMREAAKYKSTHSDTLAILYDDMGFAFLANHQMDSANYYLNMAMELIKKGKNLQQKMIILKHTGDIQKQLREYGSYSEILEQQLQLRDKIFSEQLTGAIGVAELKFNEMQSTAQLQEYEGYRRKLLIALSLSVIILTGLIVFVLWLRKNNRYIKRQQEELKISNRKLGYNEKLYRQLFENSLGLICTHTKEGRIITVNQAYEDTLKISRQYLRGKSIGELLPAKYKRLFPEYLEEVSEKGEAEGWIKIVDRAGCELVLRYQNRLMVPDSGDPFIISFAQDQTEIFKNRAEADIERRRLQTVMKNSPDIFSILKPDGTIKYMNRSNFFDAKEVVGKNVSQLVDKQVGLRFLNILRETAVTAEPVDLEAPFRDRYYLTKLIPIVNENVVKEILSINTDVTDIRKAHEDLKKAKEEAEESNRLKTIFLGSLSHEVRTPLQGILWLAELLERPSLPEAKRSEFLKIIKRRTFDMQNIIESLLDMASLETGEIKSFAEEVELHELAENIFAKIREDYLEDIPSQVKVTFDNKLPTRSMVQIDTVHFNQVVLNLFRNAMKFTNEGCITVVCKTESDAFRFDVIDTGIGIPENKLEQIFKPFRQAHEGLSRTKGGIGLGLAICKKMVDMWQGQLYVTSQPEKGSTFTFTIPKKA